MPAGPSTQISDIVTPEYWPVIVPYIQQRTVELSRIIQSGMAVMDPFLDQFLATFGKTGHRGSWQAITRSGDDDNVSNDNVADIQALQAGEGTAHPRNDSTPLKLGSSEEVFVRLSRNQSWGASDLSQQIAGSDPLTAVGDQLAVYRAQMLQRAVISTWRGVFADNTGNDSGDFTHDVKGASFNAATTAFSAEHLINAIQTMGDAKSTLSIVCVHSVVHTKMQLNNLIDYIPDSEGRVNFATFQGMPLIVDDHMPVVSSGVYETWIFSPGAMAIGMGAARVPLEVYRRPDAGNGGGQEELYDRWEWCLHPTGFAYTGATTNAGGPTNTTLATASSWDRVFPNRKQIGVARLITRES